MLMVHKQLVNNSGYSFVEVMIALGISAIGLGLAGLAFQATRVISGTKTLNIATATIRNNMISILTRNDSFKRTLDAPSSPFAGAATGGTNDFVIYDAQGNVYYDPRELGIGNWGGFLPGPVVSVGGGITTTCNNFGANGTADCPIRADVRWTDLPCTMPNCNPRLIRVDVLFRIFGGSGSINTTKFNFSVIRPRTIPFMAP